MRKLASISIETYSIYILDLRTMGLNLAEDHIIEIGLLNLNNDGDIERQFEALIKLPREKTISREITELTGITNEMLSESSVSPETAAKELGTFIDEKHVDIS